MSQVGQPSKDDQLAIISDYKGAFIAPLFYLEDLMATAKKTPATKEVKKTRARTIKGAFIADDPTTPDVNEAWVETVVNASKEFVYFESREQEPSSFDCADIKPTRNTSSGRLEWKVAKDDVARFESHFFVRNARIVRK
jgi:hypothetical protein